MLRSCRIRKSLHSDLFYTNARNYIAIIITEKSSIQDKQTIPENPFLPPLLKILTQCMT